MKASLHLLALLAAISLLGFAAPAQSHETRMAFLEVRALGDGVFVSVLKIPMTGATPWPIEVRLPAACEALGPDRRAHRPGNLVIEQRFVCAVTETVPVMGLVGLDGGFIDVLVRVEDENGNGLTRVASGALTEIPLAQDSARSWDRLLLGVEHILSGADHLLFVAGMILLVRGRRRIVATITAFTIAHSITLGLTVLEVVRVPGPPVEAFIALSIVYLAFEIVRRERTDLRTVKPWAMAFAFGLVHGFGFAGALLGAGLPSGDIPMTLLLFNLGIELGQIVFAALCGLVLWVAYRLLDSPARRAGLDRVAAYALGGIASFWFIDRFVGFWA
ncbi:MAG: HupE/UreJ family protein [Gammaproteobacteria bacterium]|nr:HupE/UreJ family protein [Gammaproteobacteria bacterium]